MPHLLFTPRLWLGAAIGCILITSARAEVPHIYGIHDDPGDVTAYLDLLPGNRGWITTAEGIGANPADMGGKAYQSFNDSTIIARLNYGFFPQGTLPPQAEYSNFAQRAANFVANSSGCTHWVIGNETNLAIEWPQVGSTLEPITPQDYAQLFKMTYNAIKAVEPEHKVIVQAMAPWAGPYGPGNLGGLSHVGQPLNWVDYMHIMLEEITSGPDAVMPDGISLHINSRGYAQSAFNPMPNTATGMNLDFSWGVHRDWIQYAIPRDLWDLPIYAKESNGLFYWKGGGPESGGDPSYVAGWMQRVYEEVDAWNQRAGEIGLPVYRCVNMYRWGSFDDWAIRDEWQANSAIWQQLSADLTDAATDNYQWPTTVGNRLTTGTPPGFPATVVEAFASSDANADGIAGFEPEKAFDSDPESKWSSVAGTLATPHWLAADLGEERTIYGYVIRHASTTGLDNVNRNTVGFLIETSTGDENGPWQLETMVRNNTPGQPGAAVTELVYDTPITARYVRIYINNPCQPSASGLRGRIASFEIHSDGTDVAEWQQY